LAGCSAGDDSGEQDEGTAEAEGSATGSTSGGLDTSVGEVGSAGSGSGTATSSDSASATSTADEGSDSSGANAFERIELRADGFSPPVTETWYSCFSFQFELDQLHHIVGFEPVVDSPIVHHYVLSLADGPLNLDPNDACFEWPAQILWAWAPGIEDQMLPEEAGFLIGDTPGGVQTFVLQVHYNDPLLQGLSDDNGIDVLVTPELRPNDAGIFSQGDIFALSIPPGQTAYEHVATCSGAQTGSALDHSIHVFASFLHAHEIGKQLWTDVYRGGRKVGTIANDDPFDFNDQKFVAADFDVEPGDTFETHCVYDSSGRTGVTPGGVASDEEMCIDFMMYYPKVGGEKCGSF
jgi:hypothetical protein